MHYRYFRDYSGSISECMNIETANVNLRHYIKNYRTEKIDMS